MAAVSHAFCVATRVSQLITSRCLPPFADDPSHEEVVEMAVPEGLVSDSERACFSVIGDLLGPTMQVG